MRLNRVQTFWSQSFGGRWPWVDFYGTSVTSCFCSGQIFCLSRGYTFWLCKQLLSGCGTVCRPSANVASTVSCSVPTSQGSRYTATLPACEEKTSNWNTPLWLICAVLPQLHYTTDHDDHDWSLGSKQPGSCFHLFVIVPSSNLSRKTTTKSFWERGRKIIFVLVFC